MIGSLDALVRKVEEDLMTFLTNAGEETFAQNITLPPLNPNKPLKKAIEYVGEKR